MRAERAEFGEFDEFGGLCMMDGRWLGIIRKSVAIFDIVDRKVWLAVGGVFRDGTAPVRLQRRRNGAVRCTCLRPACGKVLSDRSESKCAGICLCA